MISEIGLEMLVPDLTKNTRLKTLDVIFFRRKMIKNYDSLVLLKEVSEKIPLV